MTENQNLPTAQPGTQLTVAQQNVMNFKKILDGNFAQTQLKQVLKENAGTFATSLAVRLRRWHAGLHNGLGLEARNF